MLVLKGVKEVYFMKLKALSIGLVDHKRGIFYLSVNTAGIYYSLPVGIPGMWGL